jgi:hypothetical protein
MACALTGCAAVQSTTDDFAREHNIKGEQVCNTLKPDVSLEDVLERGCPVGSNVLMEGNIQNEDTEQQKEEALSPR